MSPFSGQHELLDVTPSLPDLLRDLTRSKAWPEGWAPDGAEGLQTHISLVFLAAERVVKLKKPLKLPFLDYSTQELRRAACEAECRLNARLAPDEYLGVVTVSRDQDGRWAVLDRAPGPQEEPAVLMRRLPEDRTMAALLANGALEPDDVRRVARRVAAFHDAADAGPDVQRAAGWDALASVVRGNLSECIPFVGRTIDAALHARLVEEAERVLLGCRDLVESRAAAGMGRDGHGDLRLDHVYLKPDGDIVIVDCIEFRDDFRRGDPVGDVAFLVMELRHEGRPDLASILFEEWRTARQDDDAPALLPLHLGHRQAVRGKVRSIESLEAEVPAESRRRAAARARGHFLAALGELAPASRRPALVLTCGLPGSGKSTIARALARDAGFTRVASDVTRKAMAPEGISSAELYSAEWTERTYAALRLRVEELLAEGGRVVADASFHESSRRAVLLDLARELHVPALVLECTVGEDEAVARLQARRGDESDADASVRRLMSERWEGPIEPELAAWRELPTSGSPEESARRASHALRDAGLL